MTGPASVVTAATPSTFVVDSIGDGADVSGSDGICRTASGECTLRAAIQEANRDPGHDRIEFAVPGGGTKRIEPATQLPFVTDPAGVTIDGTTQPGSSVNTLTAGSNAVIRIELKGRGYGEFDGLFFRSDGNVVRGLALFDFADHLRFLSDDTATADRNVVAGNFVGTDATGTFVAPMFDASSNAITIQGGASDNLVGGPAPADRNVISGSHGRGVLITDVGTARNVIEGNVIGLAPDGSSARRNWSHGIDVQYGARDNVVRDNVVSGNYRSGIEISHNALDSADHRRAYGGPGETTGNVVEGNLVGTDATGTRADVELANGEYGIGLEGRGLCAVTCPPDSNRNRVTDNVVIGSRTDVKIWRGSSSNTVSGNRIGVLDDGVTAPAGTTEWGVVVEVGAVDNLIEGNVVTGAATGILLTPTNTVGRGDGTYAVSGNTLRSNSIFGVSPGLAVDLAPAGSPTPSPDASLVQDGVRIGVITHATPDAVRVDACAGCVVELFLTEASASPYGQGRTSLGVATAVAATRSAATAVFTSATSPGVVALRPGDEVSALVTDRGGSTSEFSRRRIVVAIGDERVGPAIDRSASATGPAVRCALSPAC